MSNGRYLGKFRGTVLNNVDPMLKGRLQLMVPDVTGLLPSTWAEACVPLTGPSPMGTYFVPPIGSGVWVEFEQGDVNHPIWTGCRWGSPADIPPLAHLGLPTSPNIVMQSFAQHSISISDLPGPTGGVMLKSATGASIIVNDTGIYIQNGRGASITLTGPTTTINAGALAIT